MSEALENTSPVTVTESKTRAPDPLAGTPRSGSAGVWIVALVALVAAGFASWRGYSLEHAQAAAQADTRSELSARIDELARTSEQRKRDLDTMRARLADADGVNKSVREELLGLGERSRHLEDAVANLAEQRLTGRDALALNEAEFVLQQGQERLALFHDAQAAMSAYRLADSALAAAEDPVFSSVRQTIAAELRALEASKPVETDAAIVTLEHIRAALPVLSNERPAPPDTQAPSRWQGFLAQFVHISHEGDVGTNANRDIGLVRTLVAIDLRAAEAALLARDEEGFKAALARSRSGLVAGFDQQSPQAKAVLADLDRVGGQPLAPALPELGSALKELRNLRATRALAQPRAIHPTQPPAEGNGAGSAVSKPAGDDA
jgi:uroporphyrin-3 C-methyltransferase